jgi:integrase
MKIMKNQDIDTKNPLSEKFYHYLSYGNVKTARTYAYLVDDFLSFINKPPESVVPIDFTSWFSHLEHDRGFDRRTVKVAAYAVRKFYDSIGLPALKGMVPVPSVGPVEEPRWLPEKECFRLIGKEPILCVSYDLALRIGEVPLLRLDRLNLKTGEVEVVRLKHKDKVNKYQLKLSKWCLEVLERYIHNSKLEGPQLFPVSISTIHNIFKRRVQTVKADPTLTFHVLRHSRITHIAIHELEEKGTVDIVGLAKFAGHLRMDTTLLYIHLASKYLAFKR